MKKNSKFILKTTSLVLGTIFSVSMLSSCNLLGQGSGGDVTVTYDYNYEGAPDDVVKSVAEGEVAEEISATRKNHAFLGWYTSESNGSLFDFEEALYEDVTLYAQWNRTGATVTFDYNYTGAPAAKEVDVAVNATVGQPASPERDGYLFTAWYVDAACTSAYEFETAVTDDVTLYAGWEVASGDIVRVSFMWNYENAPDNGVANVSIIEKNKRANKYAATRDGYSLGAWYTEPECINLFNFQNRIQGNTTLYAKWLKINTFEAEYVDYTGMIGNGYSGNQSGVGLIQKEKSEVQGASNGYYAGWMYRDQNTLTFEIESDKEVFDAVLILRLSAEFYDMTYTSDKYLVQVNGENLSYDPISITGVPAQGSQQYKPFANFTISTSVHLMEGSNTIKLIVNNTDRLGESGTMYATAPLTDCIYVHTDAVLTWNPLVDNLKGNIS